MKKLLLGLLVASSLSCAYAQDNVGGGENTGTSQFSHFEPAPGKISRTDDSEGLFSCLFSFPQDAQPNRTENKFAKLFYEDEVVAVVPSSNDKLITYDAMMFDLWQLSFYKNRPVQAPGNYRIEIEEGFFLVGDNKTPSRKFVGDYVIEPYDFYFEPAAGVVTELYELKLTFAKAKSIKRVESAAIEIFDLYQKEGNYMTYTPDEEINGNSVNLYLDYKLTKPTTWKVCMPAGTFRLVDENGNETDSPEINESFRILNYLNGMPTPDPAPGEISHFPGTITLTIPEGAFVKTVNNMVSVYVYPINEDGSLDKSIIRYVASIESNDPNKPTRNILLKNIKGQDVSVTPAPGNYRLSIGEKLYRTDLSTEYCNAMSFDYTVVSEPVNYTVTPSKEVNNEIAEIFVNFPDATSVKLLNGEPSWLNSNVCSYTFWPRSVDETTIAFSTHSPADYPGQYFLNSASGQVEVDGKVISLRIPFTIGEESTVDSIDSNLPEVFAIYSIDGKLVKVNATAEDISSLAKGLYIIAGKKVFVK